MFDSLFGWRKANKCKRLIRRVQCRLKLLKNKRCTIIRQLREDVAQLLKYGHEQNAFNRVEQIFKDESMVEVYDLLDNFCEFIIIHLPYIRKHKDCPSDINEAVSSLVFASARCGDLPELTTVRRLFEERYGLRFTRVSLELLPGNLVNLTIRENLSIKCVPNDVKYNLVEEIAKTSCLQAEPLALEYTSEWQQRVFSRPEIQENKGEIILYNGIYKESEMQASNVTSNDGKFVDFSPELKETPMEQNQNIRKRSRRAGLVDESYSSENSFNHMPQELIYLDDIEEFKSPMNKDGMYQDQRVFVFKPSIVPTSNKCEVKEGSRRTKKSEKRHGDRRKSLFSWESRIVNDMECAIYYGNVPNQNSSSHHRRARLKKKQMKEGQKACYAKLDHPSDEMVSTCSLEEPCYHSAGDDKNDLESPPWIYYIPSSSNGVPINMEGGLLLVPLSMRDKIVFLDDLLTDKRKTQLEQVSEMVSPPTEKGENRHNYLRTMTMPPERPKKDVHCDNFLRSSSFPVQQHSDRLSNASSTCPHVHPNLPDYDELAAKFMALKKEVLQKKIQQ